MKSFDPIRSFRDWARRSPWLVMSALAHVILIVSLGLVVIQHQKARRVEAQPMITLKRNVVELPVEIPDSPPIPRSAIPPEQLATLVLPEEDFRIFDSSPLPEEVVVDPGVPDGAEGADFGGLVSSGPIGPGTGSPRGPGPSAFPGRPGGPGGPLLPKGGDPGPTKGTETAILQGMRWLVRHQNADGSWGARSARERCLVDSPCFDPKASLTDHYDEGLTGLALLCFLGAGFSHESQQYIVDPVHTKRYRVGEVVKKGLEWLRKRQNAEGSFSRDRSFMYNEALATMAMTEAYGLTQSRYWGEPAQKGVDFLQRAQRPSPSGQGSWGWRYAARQEVEDFRKGTGVGEPSKELFDSDTSVTAWCVMALKSAQLSGLQVEQQSMDGALAFCEFVTADDGLVGYLDRKGAGQPLTGPNDHFTYHTGTMSALGMCIRTFTRHDADDPFLELAARRIVQDLPSVSKDRLSIDYYYWYYASIALNQLDGEGSPRKTGKYWNPWNKAMVAAVLPLQDATERACTHGGWIAGDRWSYSGGPLYSTAINVLTLEVYYRYENVFGGGKRN